MKPLQSGSLADLKNGYTYREADGAYCCLFCGREYHGDEVYPGGETLYTARGAVKRHVELEHGGVLEALLSLDRKQLSLTGVQRELLRFTAAGVPDREIARLTGTAESTVRHQRFLFREKARQARLYLAAYETAFASGDARKAAEGKASATNPQSEFINIHGGATMIDDRYHITGAEEDAVLTAMFASLDPLRLKVFPAREKKKIVVLRRIAAQFQPGNRYPEKEVNRVLKDIFSDHVTLRRYLIEYGFLERTTDCSEYWRKEAPSDAKSGKTD